MPQAIVAAATYISAAIGGAAAAAGASLAVAGTIANVAFAAVEVGIYAGLSIALNAAFGPKPPALGSVSTPIKQSLPPRQSGFGRTRLSGPYMLFAAIDGVSFDVIAIHDGRIDAYERYFLNDDEVEINGPGGGIWCPKDPKKYAYGTSPGDRVFINTTLGLATETALTRPVAGVPTLWTALCRGDGIASLGLTCKQSKAQFQQEDFPNGLPLPSTVARLQKVFDPRAGEDQADTSTYAWSANPVLALLSYLTNASGGMGLDYARRIAPTIATWTAAADDCDLATALLNGGTEPRYACGGVYQHTTAPSDVVNQLLQSFDGWLSQRGDGALVVLSGRYVAPTVTIRDEHVVAYTVQHFQADEQAVNELVPSFTDPSANYNTTDAPAWQDAADIAARGIVRSDTLPLPWVQSPSQARRLAKRKMTRLTATLRGTLTTNLYGLVALGERYLTLRIAENASLANIVVEISNVEIDLAQLQVIFTWVQADPDIDAWNRFAEENPLDPATAVPDVALLSAPTIDSVTAVYDRSASSDRGARLQLAITAPIAADVQWLVRWRPSGHSPPSNWTEGSYSDIDDGAAVELLTGFVTATGTLDVQAAYVTAGGTSPWSATATITLATPTSTFTAAVGSTLVEGTGVTITDNGDGTFTFDAVTGGVTASITASEALTAGQLVNLHTVTGAIRMRKANATDTSKPAQGFVLANVSSSAVGTFYGPGQVITGLSGLTPGATYWLDTTGGALTVTAPSTTLNGDQEVGQALSATTLLFNPKTMFEAP